MPDARDVVRVPHYAAWLAFWTDCSPIDSVPIIAFSRETARRCCWSKSETKAYAHTHAYTQILFWLLRPGSLVL